MPFRATEIYTSAVLFLGSAFFVHSLITLAIASSNIESRDEGIPKQRKSAAASKAKAPLSKLVSQSSVSNMTYTATLEDCQTTIEISKERPKLRAGALLKLIDIAAGVTARRHANLPCVTISVDSVLFLKPIYLGDLIHISASVNRAWGTSMEIGVKVTKSNEKSSKEEYVSHSYLTFVAIRPIQSAEEKNSNLSTTLWDVIWPDTNAIKVDLPKVILPPVKPSSRLEARRHLLAGRRRAKRIDDAKRGEARDGVSMQVKEQVRQELIDIIKGNSNDKNEEEWQQNRLRALEIEYVIRSWSRQEDGIYAKDGRVYVDLPGDEPFSHSEKEIRMTAKALGVNLPGDEDYRPNRRLSVDFFNPSWMRNRSSSTSISERKFDRKSLQSSTHLPVESTLTTTMHLVFPQHTNSHSIIFGGNTMSWSEEVALMACRKLRVQNVEIGRGAWKTVALDGLEFNVKVAVGELMILSAIVIKTYTHSCEVYVMAQAEGRDGKRRFTNDALFSLALDHKYDEKVEISSGIEMPVNSALETFAAASYLRRQQRLEMKNLLTRIYE